MSSRQARTPTASQYLWLAHGLGLLTVYGSLIPLRYRPLPFDQALDLFAKMTLFDPRLTEARGDWVVNMVQYAAVTFCYAAALGVDRRWVLGLAATVVLLPAGWTTAVGLEFFQVYFPPRTVSMNDILVECLGVVLGAGAWLVAGQRFTDHLRRFWGSKGLAGLASQALPVYLGVLLVTHLMPFDLVFRQAEIAEKFLQGRINLVPFGDLADGLPALLHMGWNFAAFLPLGILSALTPHSRKWNGSTTLLVGLGVTGGIEVGQLLVYTRSFNVTDIMTGSTAVLLGRQLGRLLEESWATEPTGGGSGQWVWEVLRRPPGPWGPVPLVLLALGWAVVLVLLNWQPFHFTLDPAQYEHADAGLSDEDTGVAGLRRMSWAPFVDYYWGSRYQALDQFVQRSLSFLPLGAFLGLAFGRRERLGEAICVLAALPFGTLIEFGQYFIPERHPSVTDLLIQTFGAWLGCRLVRHVGRALEVAPDAPDRAGSSAATSQVVPKPQPVVLTTGWLVEEWTDPSSLRRGNSASLPRLAPPDRERSPLHWLQALPYWVWVVLIGVAGIVLPVALVFLLAVLGA
jgi:glycopeptide antibiotics resistance protein